MTYAQYKVYQNKMAQAALIEDNSLRLDAIRKLVNHRPKGSMTQLLTWFRQWQTERSNPYFTYMITFTTDPKKTKAMTPDQIKNTAEKYLNSRLQTKELLARIPQTWLYSLEHHKDGRIHFHALLQTEKSCPPSVFRDWRRKLGNLDFSKSKSRDPLHTLYYITKETVPIVLKQTEKVALYLTQMLPRKPSETSEK